MSLNLPTRTLVSQADHAMSQRPDIPRSKFLGSWTRKTTFDQGYLVPFMVDEILPGDQMKYDVTAYIRMATPLFPMFDNMRIDTFFFFVPNRIVWENFQRMMGEQRIPSDSIAFTVPQITSPVGGFANHSVYDQMGIPGVGQLNAGDVLSINALPLRAYKRIYLDWFRDQNLIDAGVPVVNDGPDASTLYTLYRRAKSADYFTSALPWPQKFTSPGVPLQGSAKVTGIGAADQTYGTGPFNIWETNATATTPYSFGTLTTAANKFYIKGSGSSAATPQIFADLSSVAIPLTINSLRNGFLIQQLLERDARGGTRYTEIIRSHFGIASLDARLDRPEYIGGGSTPLVLTPVAQTAGVSSPLGTLGGAATATGSHRASYAATEHGFVIGLINVKSEISYQQGVHRMWSRRTRYDYYWPSLSGLGEQAIETKELYVTGNGAVDPSVFGYQERWHEYRTRYSDVAGAFRSTTAGTLDAWHLAGRFLTQPFLNQTFIEDAAPVSRILAAGAAANNQQFLADILIRRDATRPIPTYGTPVELGRF